MATTTYTDSDSPGFWSRVSASIKAYLTAFIEAQSRLDRVQRLQNMSDAELAKVGLRREDIVRHVFRDRAMM